MANRVYLTKDFLKLSKPGVNAMTSANSGLLFSSDFLALDRIAFGAITINTTYTNINYPYTLPRLPLVTALVQIGAGVWWATNRGNQFDGTEPAVQMYVETHRVSFRTLNIPSAAIRYSVWIQ